MIRLALIAQLGIGITNFGPLATEVDHRVRAVSTPGSLTLNLTHRYRFVTIGMSVTPTSMWVASCRGMCDTTAGKLARTMRPDSLVAEWDVVFVTPRVGIHGKVGTAVLSGGVALPMLQAPYGFVGASPMATPAYWTEAQLGALYFLVTVVPPSRYRWTALSEWTGYKEPGQLFPGGQTRDPRKVYFMELGLRL